MLKEPLRQPSRHKRPKNRCNKKSNLTTSSILNIVQAEHTCQHKEPQTYSIQYLGITNGEIGVLTKRMPFPVLSSLETCSNIPMSSINSYIGPKTYSEYKQQQFLPSKSQNIQTQDIYQSQTGIQEEPSASELNRVEFNSSQQSFIPNIEMDEPVIHKYALPRGLSAYRKNLTQDQDQRLSQSQLEIRKRFERYRDQPFKTPNLRQGLQGSKLKRANYANSIQRPATASINRKKQYKRDKKSLNCLGMSVKLDDTDLFYKEPYLKYLNSKNNAQKNQVNIYIYQDLFSPNLFLVDNNKMGCYYCKREQFHEEKAIIESEKSLKYFDHHVSKLYSAFINNSLKQRLDYFRLRQVSDDLNLTISNKSYDIVKKFYSLFEEKDGMLNLKRILTLSILLGQGNKQEKAQYLFRVYDSDKEYSLDRDIIFQMIQDIFHISSSILPKLVKYDNRFKDYSSQITRYLYRIRKKITSASNYLTNLIMENLPSIDEKTFIQKLAQYPFNSLLDPSDARRYLIFHKSSQINQARITLQVYQLVQNNINQLYQRIFSLSTLTIQMSSARVTCVKGEIYNLLAIMRFVPNFSQSSELVTPTQFLTKFRELFEQLVVSSDIDQIDFWDPFLSIIEASDVSGPITGVALSSIHKFLLYNFLEPNSGYTLSRIINSVIQCGFPHIFRSSDEVVLMKLLQVLLECVRSQSSSYISDECLWNILKRCFDVYEYERISELLKKTTQNTLLQMFIIIFSRIDNINEEGYGVEAFRLIILYLAQLMAFTDKDQSVWKERRCLGLFLLNTTLETAGTSIGKYEKVVNVIQDDICKSLLVNSTTEDLFILSLTLRVVFNLFQSVKQHLKVQLEVFFNSIHLKIAGSYEDDHSTYQRSELALESLIDFCREPSLILELYTNYDCDAHFANLFESLGKFLCKYSFPIQPQLHRLNELCLEGLQAILGSIAMRCEKFQHPASPNVSMRSKRKEKEKFQQSAMIFNQDPKNFVQKLQQTGHLPKNCDNKQIAKFLFENPAIDKNALGEYLGKNKPENEQVLEQFMKQFNYEGLRIDEALKIVLSSFRIPGEAQVIDRIMQYFSLAFYTEDSIFANSDAAYVLAFSIMQLHTDQHNPGVKRRMTEEDYIKNVRGINGGSDFPREMLLDIYNNIKKDPIQVLELSTTVEHDDLNNPEMASYKWGNIIKKTQFVGNYFTLNELLLQPAGENEKDMFEILWEAGLLGTISKILQVTSEGKAMGVIKELSADISKISNYYNLKDHLSRLIGIFTQAFIMQSDSIPSLHTSYKAQHALELAVCCAVLGKDSLQGSWGDLIQCLLRLHSLGLLPNDLIELEDFVDSEGRVLPIYNFEDFDLSFLQYFKIQGQTTSSQISDEDTPREEIGSIWTSFTKYLGVPSEPIKRKEDIIQDMKNELKQVVLNTGIHLLFANSRSLDKDSLHSLIKALLQKCKECSDEINSVLCLELSANILIANYSRITPGLWKFAISNLEGLLRKETWLSERALVCLLRVCITHHEFVQEIEASLHRVLDYMVQLPKETFQHFSERLLAGLLLLSNSASSHVLTTQEAWPLLVKTLEKCQFFPQAASCGFEILSFLLQQIEANSADFKMYEELLELICAYIKSPDAPKNRVESGINLIRNLESIFDQKHKDDVIIFFWKKVLGIVGRLCKEPRHLVRVLSYSMLQELILSERPELNSWNLWREIFERVLLPLVIEPFTITQDMISHLNSEEAGVLKQEYEDTRERAVGLTCQTVLSRINIIPPDELKLFWPRVLKILGQTIVSRNQQEINERNYEQVKNLLLVIKAEGVLDEETWSGTWEVIQVPVMKEELDGTNDQGDDS